MLGNFLKIYFYNIFGKVYSTPGLSPLVSFTSLIADAVS
jgi:hypothetical protein